MASTGTSSGTKRRSATADESKRAEPASESELPGLMVRYQAGEVAAVEELVHRLSPSLWRYFVSSHASWSDSEDLLQDCWIRIHRSRQTYRPAEPVLPWIFAIARHTRLDGYRRRRRRESRETLVATPPEVAVRAEPTPPEPGRLRHLLEQLPYSQREVIVMLKVSDMSLEEVARATSSTVGAIKQKAHRAYAKLRQFIEKEGQ
jgi:RNA polymerase sigma-70 factor, ECF subfamily